MRVLPRPFLNESLKVEQVKVSGVRLRGLVRGGEWVQEQTLLSKHGP